MNSSMWSKAVKGAPVSLIIEIFKHRLFRGGVTYFFATIIGSAIPMLLLPVLTRYLTPMEYGTLAIFQVIVSLLVILIGIDTHAAVGVVYFQKSGNEIRSYIGNILLVIVACFVMFLFIAVFFHRHIAQTLNIPPYLIFISLFVAFFTAITNVGLMMWQVTHNSKFYALYQVSMSLFNALSSILLVVIFHMGLKGRIFGISSAAIVFGFISMYILFRNFRMNFKIKKEFIKDIFIFSLPLVPHEISGWIMSGTDKIFLNNFVGLKMTGIYSVGYQIGMILGLVTAAFNRAWGPYLFQALSTITYSKKIKIVKVTYLYFIVILLLAFLLSMVSPIIIQILVNKNFQASNEFVIWIALGAAAMGMYYMVVNYLFFVKKTHILALATFISALVNIGLNYSLIKMYGAMGAAKANAISSFFTFFLVWLLSAKYYPMPWFSWSKIKSIGA
ncbi:MAG: oligosaccharide flippase family protein [Candidatus Omnitrophica bacterium]|nr:oligosaccharide flippase family protein [Candidatus Omnitrophota bacterium]